jgi:hypothetical protein
LELIGCVMRRVFLAMTLLATSVVAGHAQLIAVRASWGGAGAPAFMRAGPGFRFAWSGGHGFRFGAWSGGFVRGPIAAAWRPRFVGLWSPTVWTPSPAPLGMAAVAGRGGVPLIVPDPVSFEQFIEPGPASR